MSQRRGAVHVVTMRTATPTACLRRICCAGAIARTGKVKNETVGSLSHLLQPLIEVIRRALYGESSVPVGERLQIERSKPHGQARAVRAAMRRQRLKILPIYATERSCIRPTTEWIPRLYAYARRHILVRAGRVVHSFVADLTPWQQPGLELRIDSQGPLRN